MLGLCVGVRVRRYGLWVMGYRLGLGLFVMDYGLWVTGYRLWVRVRG